ncbi:MAG: pantoate--beta-alanine ligase [Candidatus Omnitrophica bacterium]|nr:pantoate--beta-alanine ligase [Candidatus Omnitrophota bacterium]
MVIIRTIKRLRQVLSGYNRKGRTIGFVPTMGALHYGHLSLIKACRRENKIVVVSIFVNPTQFGPGEDLKKYPRTLKQDAALCKKEGVDIIFYPDAKEMFPSGYETFVTVEGLSRELCGLFRPGHFRGVATVVAKLFNIVQPDIAYFGQKDAQQAAIVRRMVRDLNMPVKIKVMPTVREIDGLAMSSRNAYLNPLERKDALVLSRSLALAKRLVHDGVKDIAEITGKIREMILRVPKVKIDYIAVVDQEHLMPLKKISGKSLIALAVWIGKTRLIDNIIIK